MRRIRQRADSFEDLDALVGTTPAGTEDVERELDASDFTRIYRQHRRFVGKALGARGVRPDEVEDAVQEVFLTLLRRAPALEGEFVTRAWLHKVASNVALNCSRTLRRREPHRALDSSRVELELVGDERSQSPERRTATQEQYARVCRIIDRLDAKRRSVAVLYYFEQLSPKDIARRLGTRESTVSSRLRVARAELQAAMTDYAHREHG